MNSLSQREAYVFYIVRLNLSNFRNQNISKLLQTISIKILTINVDVRTKLELNINEVPLYFINVIGLNITTAIGNYYAKSESQLYFNSYKTPVIVFTNIKLELSYIPAKLFRRSLRELFLPKSVESIKHIPSLQESVEISSSSQYRFISLLTIISTLFQHIINKHLDNYNRLSEEQYIFRVAGSTADVLDTIIH